MSLRKEVYHYGSTIVRQGDPPPGLLFIIQYVKTLLIYLYLNSRKNDYRVLLLYSVSKHMYFSSLFLEARRKLWWTQRNILVNSQSCSIKIMYQYKTNLTGTCKRKIFSYTNYDELSVLYVCSIFWYFSEFNSNISIICFFYNRTSHIRSKGEVERDVLQKQVRVRRRDGYVAAEKRQRNMSVELCCVERHDVIGEN